jgi:hypothetical protein
MEVKFGTWYKEETSVYGHLLLPLRDVDKIRHLTNCIMELDYYLRFNMVDEYNWDELHEVLKEFGLKHVKTIDAPISERGLREAIGKEGFAYCAGSQNGDLYAFFLTDDYSEFYIFQFTKTDISIMKIYEKLKEEENNVNLARDIAREELEMLKLVQELMSTLQSAPPSPPERTRWHTSDIVELWKKTREQLKKATALPISILERAGRAANIIYTEKGDKHVEVYLVFGKHGIYIVAFTVPTHWWEKEEGWKVLDVLVRRVDPDTASSCFEEEGCQLLRELF